MTTTSMDVVDQEAERKKLKKEKKRKVGAGAICMQAILAGHVMSGRAADM